MFWYVRVCSDCSILTLVCSGMFWYVRVCSDCSILTLGTYDKKPAYGESAARVRRGYLIIFLLILQNTHVNALDYNVSIHNVACSVRSNPVADYNL